MAFLGNLNWEKLADVLDVAAEMNRPGGNVAALERNQLAKRVLLNKIAEDNAQKAAQARLIGGYDPTSKITWNTGRQAPTSIYDMDAPELAGAPRGNAQIDISRMMQNDLDLADAQKRFAKQQSADMAQAFPEAMAASVMQQMAPMTPYQRAQLENEDRRFELQSQRDEARAQEAQTRFDQTQTRIEQMAENQRLAEERAAEIARQNGARLDQQFDLAIMRDPPPNKIVNPEYRTGSNEPMFILDKRKMDDDTSTLESIVNKADADIKTIDDLLASPYLDQAVGQFMGDREGRIGKAARATPGMQHIIDVDSQFDTIGSMALINQLLDVKAQGGTFGALSEKEGEALRSAIASLKQTQSAKQVRKALKTIKEKFEKVRQAGLNRYKRTWGQNWSPSDDIDVDTYLNSGAQK